MIEMDVLGGTCGESREVHRGLVAKAEGKRQRGRPRHKWEHHINTDLQEVNWGHGLD